MKIKLEEIEKNAGGSVTTVSMALNNKKGVSKDTRQRIFEIAKNIGYSLQDNDEKNEYKNLNLLNRELRVRCHCNVSSFWNSVS